MPIKEETVHRYVTVLEEVKILYRCPRFDMKARRSLAREQKYYLADLGFYFALNTDNRINYGPVLENVVYEHTRDGYSKYLLACDRLLQKRSGVTHENLVHFVSEERRFGFGQ